MREMVGELRAVVPAFVERFEELYGYPPGDHVIGDSDYMDTPEGTTTAWSQLPAEWREFLVECSEISLPDLWNGVFIGPARWIQAMSSEVEAVETDAGPVPVIAVGSDGGGGYFLVRRGQSGPIFHVGVGALKGGLLSPSGKTATIADSLDEFVGKIVLAVKRATNGANTNPFDSA